MAAIFVECHIRSDLERVWELTQNPQLHQRWDLRFTEISYLPKSSTEETQKFLYRTHIGFGVPIEGEGESVGERCADGKRSSALRFWSSDWKSLIKDGSGFWQYEPSAEGTVFRTRYDYRVRFGALGKLLDLAFRPILGRATSWSFDALRLWAERDIPPEASVLRMRIHAISRIGLALAWAYSGVVPKLLIRNSGELDLIRASGIPERFGPASAYVVGFGELLLAAALIVFWRTRWILIAQAMLVIVLPLGLIASKPEIFSAPFNPLTLGLAMVCLGLCSFLAAMDMPWAGACQRRPS